MTGAARVSAADRGRLGGTLGNRPNIGAGCRTHRAGELGQRRAVAASFDCAVQNALQLTELTAHRLTSAPGVAMGAGDDQRPRRRTVLTSSVTRPPQRVPDAGAASTVSRPWTTSRSATARWRRLARWGAARPRRAAAARRRRLRVDPRRAQHRRALPCDRRGAGAAAGRAAGADPRRAARQRPRALARRSRGALPAVTSRARSRSAARSCIRRRSTSRGARRRCGR